VGKAFLLMSMVCAEAQGTEEYIGCGAHLLNDCG
jgi:hypothetical protein